MAADEIAEQMAWVPPAVPLVERIAIIQSVRYVDVAVPQQSGDALAVWFVFGQ